MGQNLAFSKKQDLYLSPALRSLIHTALNTPNCAMKQSANTPFPIKLVETQASSTSFHVINRTLDGAEQTECLLTVCKLVAFVSVESR